MFRTLVKTEARDIDEHTYSVQYSVFQLLGDTRLDDGLGGNLDRLTGCRIPAHPRFPLLDYQLHHPGQHELSGALQLLLRQRRELVEVLAGLRALHLEPFGEVRKEFGFAHPPGVSHRHAPSLDALDVTGDRCARSKGSPFSSENP